MIDGVVETLVKMVDILLVMIVTIQVILSIHTYMCVLCVCVCVRACVRACVRVCVCPADQGDHKGVYVSYYTLGYNWIYTQCSYWLHNANVKKLS